MYKLIIFLIFIISFHFTDAQNDSKITNLQRDILKKSQKYTYNDNIKKARYFFAKNEWDSTLVYTSKALTLDKKNKTLNNYCYLFRGYSFMSKNLFKEANNQLQKITSDFYFFHHTKVLLGEIAINQGNYKLAIELLKKTEESNLKYNLGLHESNIMQNIGVAYLHMNKYEASEPYLLKSIEAFEQEKDTSKLLVSYQNVANLYYEQYKDKQAIPYFIKAYELAKHINNFQSRQDTALNMAVVEENRKDYIKSLAYRKEFDKWKDSLNNQNRIYETAQLEKKIAVEQKEGEIKTLEAENRAKEAERNLFLVSAGVLLLLLGASIYFYRQKVKTNKVISAQKEALDDLNATKDKLFSIVSHDLRSSVNAIKTSNKKLINNLETQNKTEIHHTLKQNSAIVNGAYGLLDNLLNWALLQTKKAYFEMTPLHLSIIVDHVAYNYKAILEEKNIRFQNTISKKIEVFADQESLKIILRNLLDNAIKFSEIEGKITIYSRDLNDDYVYLVVEDSGIGMDANTKNELLKDTQLLSKKKHEDILGTGLGLHLVKSMAYKNNGKFDIESDLGKGTKIIIALLKSVPNGIS